ncbi:MAG: ABC transporter substrate-binding protein [Bosea sp.]|nr:MULTISPECIES: ABC transporter substrate-binding protein [unclassified Bradyrhizobium]MCP4561848.1 ABC transporter substrate-binding protein [Bosea sp. (in: a-proteobacteria)]MCP4738191.1 ABC transporter substrate-binding protein [Bosea sp. (in: a-proteobacteria)]MDX3804853.1 ABC transporter substrate-binding protein [Bosea sp. (in: a-proteobacteria)]
MTRLSKLAVLFCAWIASHTLAHAQNAASQVTVLRAAEAERYDPQKIVSRPMNEVMFLLADTLLALDYDQKTIKPLLARSWSVSADGLTYRFALRDDVRYCDGRPMKAEDVVYSLKRWIAPETRAPLANQAGSVKDIRAEDETTVVYELAEPYSELLINLTQVSSSIVDRNEVEKLGPDFGVKHFNGTGPYCWVRWLPRNEMVLKRNQAYVWGPDFYQNRGPAQVEQLVLKQVPDEGTRMAAMMAGQADLTQYVPRWSISRFEGARQFTVARPQAYFSLLYLGFKTDRPLVSDVRVRKAMNLALNRDELARSVFFGRAEPASAYIHPQATDYNAELATILPKFDLAQANALLDSAGWIRGADGFRVKDGVRLAPVVVIPAPILADAAQAIQGSLRQIGVDVRLELLDGAVFFQRASQQDFEMYGLQQPYLTAGMMMADNFSSKAIPAPNRMNWRNAEFDALLRSGRSATDAANRSEAFKQAQLIAHRDFVWMPLVHDQAYMVIGSRLTPMKAHGNQAVTLYKGLDMRLK